MQKIKAFGTWLRTSKNGFFTLAVFGYWLKCYLIYLTKFSPVGRRARCRASSCSSTLFRRGC